MSAPAAPIATADVPRRIRSQRTRADRVYRLTASGAGLVTLVVLFLIGLFLFLRALPAFRENGLSFFTTTGWNPSVPHETGVAALLYGTLVVATIALVLAVPVDGSDPGWVAAMLTALRPNAVWAVVDATRKPADLIRWLDGIGAVDAVAVHAARAARERSSSTKRWRKNIFLAKTPLVSRSMTTNRTKKIPLR